MNTLQDTAQRRADAHPRDYPEDFDDHKELSWVVCVECLHVFLGEQKRIQCHRCKDERRTI